MILTKTNLNFKENLKLLRKENGITQDSLAKLLNTTTKTISHWETGYAEPSLAQLLKIAEVFEITVDELLT